MSGRSLCRILCPDEVMYGGVLSKGVLSDGILSGEGFVPDSLTTWGRVGSKYRFWDQIQTLLFNSNTNTLQFLFKYV